MVVFFSAVSCNKKDYLVNLPILVYPKQIYGPFYFVKDLVVYTKIEVRLGFELQVLHYE